jgi:hypothetical protein
MAGPITMENVDTVFGSVPLDEGQKAAIELVTARFTQLARDIIAHVPNCAHRSAALRDILIAKWACVDAIAKGGLV